MMDDIADYGRLCNRTQLASLCADLVDRPIAPIEDNKKSQDVEEEEDDDEATFLFPINYHQKSGLNIFSGYKRFKDISLRKDANVSDDDDVNENID
jgi:hypothetical protein